MWTEEEKLKKKSTITICVTSKIIETMHALSHVNTENNKAEVSWNNKYNMHDRTMQHFHA